MSHLLPAGFRFASAACAIKSRAGAKDIALIVSDHPAAAAGVYTQNQVVAAPVVLCRGRTPMRDARAIVVNSGNANACTGVRGMEDAQRMCELTAGAIVSQAGQAAGQVRPDQVLVMSTGVIGRFLPMDKVERGIQSAAAQLADTESGFLNAAEGILTTDNGRKVTSRQMTTGGRTIRMAGMAKGAGMIGPNMATMLCCVVTDATLSAEQVHELLKRAADKSFNNISVEGHTSTNDTMLLLANGASGGEPLMGVAEQEFAENLEAMCIELAKQIPADGEGATHLIEVDVRGAQSDLDARKIAHTVACSNLVKSAVFGCDPNWGRIVSAAGYSGVSLDLSRLELQVNGMLLFQCGEPVAFDASSASQSIRENHLTHILLIVGDGPGQCRHWTSDLTLDYVRFNSEYTT